MIFRIMCSFLVLTALVGTAFASSGEVSKSVSPKDTIRVDIETDENGSLTMSPSCPRVGERVDFKLFPADGYEIDTATVIDTDGNVIKLKGDGAGLYFEAPDRDVRVIVKFRAVSVELPFSDVFPNDWYYNDVRYLYISGIAKGTNEITFSPDNTMSRGELITMLWHMVGAPEADTKGTYTDVSQDDRFATAVEWAVQKGIVTGVGEGRFLPYEPITREQIIAILFRYAQKTGYSMDIQDDILDGFLDASKISGYAKKAMMWACSYGLIVGNNGRLNPLSYATRVETSAILHRFVSINVQG